MLAKTAQTANRQRSSVTFMVQGLLCCLVFFFFSAWVLSFVLAKRLIVFFCLQLLYFSILITGQFMGMWSRKRESQFRLFTFESLYTIPLETDHFSSPTKFCLLGRG